MKSFRRCNSWLLAAAASASLVCTPLQTLAADDDTAWIDSADLTNTETAAPAKDDVLPNANQFRYQKDELAAFCHFGPNTFNEIEWGESYGNRAPSDIFRLDRDVDADNFVKTLKDAGFKKLIVTAKHHDGFCIWNSAYTTYDCAAAGYKNGEGDVLADLSAACTKYDLDMGLYLSPWDIHDPSYGYKDANGNPTTEENDVLDYNDYYNNQLDEILGSDKYGNNGHFVEVWMDGAKGSGANAQEYDFQRWFATIQKHEGVEAGFDADCMLFGAESYTTVRWIGNELGYAGQNTWSKVNVDRENNTMNDNKSGGYSYGYENGNQWAVPEADARITSGWFWGTTKNTPKSLEDLSNMYFGSVGHGATLLLNIPLNNQGALDEAIKNRTLEFGQMIQDSFDNNLIQADGVTVQADNVRGNSTSYSPELLIDDDDQSVWSTSDGTATGSLLVDFGEAKEIDCVSLEEAIQYGQRINSYTVEYQNASGEWNALESGVTVGPKRLIRTAPFRTQKLKITVSTPDGKTPVLSEIGAYKLNEDMEKTGGAPTGMIITDVTSPSVALTGTWNAETGMQYTNNTNKWANAGNGTTMTWTFTGTKGYIVGTLDSGHGTADIEVDGQAAVTINMSQSPRKVGQILFETATLEPGTHTVKITPKTKATGVEAFYSINNENKGMVGIEQTAYTMGENETMNVKLVRTGGTAPIDVTFSPNPGSAIQDDFNTELIHQVHFGQDEMEKTVTVETRRNTNNTGNLQFSVELSSADPDVILGFDSKANVTILDTESNFENYTESNPFVFPTNAGQATLEAEHAILTNTGAADERWKLNVAEAAWASNGKYVDSCNENDYIEIPYTAAQTGDYTFTLTYRSGATNNAIAWSEANGKITSGSVSAGAENTSASHTATFTVTVVEAGPGVLKIAAGPNKAPQMDKFDITAPEAVEPELDKSLLETAINDIPEDRSAFVENEALSTLEEALNRAKGVFEASESQEEINQAAMDLNQAWLGVRLSPDAELLASMQ
ncbi:alpha-L-fucosidase [Allobaculum mucilyticum]|uniref:alpha-L-fucosidase n=1 Tax=Allobaculum mucilyticum TaxID=2834459 RepID=UPI001E348BE8|nr:alpha-L-fucosidase [Allobaculum mucilyticum]UNT95612.1 alpha-L-fucosidase [Allobaculum mucilyticum]